ncbi:MAG: protein kinase, partial [Gemmatimonadales bacterium]
MDLDRLRSALRDRYELERELGSGGMATVYLATDLKHDRKVAIKVLRPELAASLGTDRFLHEIEIADKLQHPHILMLIDSGDAAGLPYYVMPYIDGESLREKLDREKQLPIEVALQIARQVAAALAHAHKHGVIHRDIKPANILLAGDDVVVADFGIARAVSQAERRELTETGMVLGTPTYMSPEQIASRDAVDGRTDIYALACVLYEMLAGEPPFGGHSAQVIMARHAIDPPPPLRTVRTSVPISLENALFTAMQKSPADRYSSATHFSQVLLECGREISGAFTPPDLPEPTIDTQPSEESSKGLASPRLRDFALGAVLVAVLVVIFGQPWTRPAAEQTGALNPFVASVAVMPFLNQTGDAELDMVGDVLTGEIIAHLSEIDTLKVISLESVLLLRDRELSPPEISEVLGVEHIILGTLRSDASGVSVSAQLTTGRDEATLWSESFEDDPSNSQGLERIATIVTERYVASVGGVSFIPRPRHVVLTPGTVSYQLGVEWLQMRTPRGINNAISSFGEAIAIDSSLAKAYAGLSSALALALTYRYETGLDGYRQAGLAFAAATKAVELNPGEAEGFSARGYIA